MLISICDDEEKQGEYLRELLTEWCKNKGTAAEINVYKSAEQYLFNCEDTPCELLLLDIEMGKMDGLSMAKELRRRGNTQPIIFITGYPEYISEGYDVEALHYLIKPVGRERLFKVLDRFFEKRSAFLEELIIETEKGLTHISADRVVYAEAVGKKIRLYLSDGSDIECIMKIGEFCEKKLRGFISCHRSYAVNLRYVRSIGKNCVVTDNRTEIPVSRKLYNEVSRKFIEYWKREIL